MDTVSEFFSAEKQSEVTETVAALYTKSIERVAEAHKNALDLAVKQNGDLVSAWKRIAPAIPGFPIVTIADLFAGSFGQFVELQKGAIDMAIEQSQTMASLARQRFESATKATDAATTMVEDAIERAAATQQNAMDFSAAQTKTAIDAYKSQPGVAGTPAEAAAESMQQGVDSLVDTHKQILTAASRRRNKARV